MEQNVIKKTLEQNLDLDWWFEELGKSTTKVTEKIAECKEIKEEDDKEYTFFSFLIRKL